MADKLVRAGRAAARALKQAEPPAVDPLMELRAVGPAIHIPNAEVLHNLDLVAQIRGREMARRLERAQDEGANLSYFNKDALLDATDPKTAPRFTVIDPKTFQNYATAIHPDTLKEVPYPLASEWDLMGNRGALKDVLENYAQSAREGKWRDVPELGFDMGRRSGKWGYGPLDYSAELPFIDVHNGRHRMMTQAGPLKQKKSLVVLKPAWEDQLRYQSNEENAESFRKLLQDEGSGRVIPQSARWDAPLAARGFQSEDELPRFEKTWAEGGYNAERFINDKYAPHRLHRDNTDPEVLSRYDRYRQDKRERETGFPWEIIDDRKPTEDRPGNEWLLPLDRNYARPSTFAEGGYNDDDDERLMRQRSALNTPPMEMTPTLNFALGKGKGTVGLGYDQLQQVIDAMAGLEMPIGSRGMKLGVQGNYNKYIGEGGEQAKPNWGVNLRLGIPFAEGGHVQNFKLGDKVKGAIRTYTGSPHKFDKFDPAYIGKGEGSAAYGHGFYSAENPKVGEEYRRITAGKSESPGQWLINGVPDDLRVRSTLEALIQQHYGLQNDPAMREGAANAIAERLAAGKSPKWVAQDLMQYMGIDPDATTKVIQGMPPGYRTTKPGYLYHLDINAPPEQFLDWDAPLTSKANAPILGRIGDHPHVIDAMNDVVDRQGFNGISEVPGDYSGRDLHRALTHYDVMETLPTELPGSSLAKDYGENAEKRHVAAFLSSLDVPGVRYLDNFSRPSSSRYNELGRETRNYVTFPQSADLIDIVKREKAEGGMLRKYRAGGDGEPDDSTKGALSGPMLAGIDPLKWIRFAKNLKEEMPPVQQQSLEKILDYTGNTGKEAVIHGRYGDDVAKPYLSKMTTGDETSIVPPKTLSRMWAPSTPGQPWSMHSHPTARVRKFVPGGEDVPWSTVPSAGDVNLLLTPKSIYSMLNDKLPEMIITNEQGNLIRIGGLHHTAPPKDGGGYYQARDTIRHVREMLGNKELYGTEGLPYKESLDAKYLAMKDWADAHGVNFEPLVHRLENHPFAPGQKLAFKDRYNPAGHDLAAAGSYERLGQMGIPVEMSGKFVSDPRVDIRDAMQSWASYLEGKMKSPFADINPSQMNFDFPKAEGGPVRNYRFGGFGLPDYEEEEDDDSEYPDLPLPGRDAGALTQVGWKAEAAEAMKRKVAKVLEREAEMNAARPKGSEMLYLPPNKIQTVTDPERMAFAGIYKSPQQIVEEAKAKYDPGDIAALKRLFGVDRQDLDDISQGRDWSHLLMQPHAFYPKPGATGSAASEKVLTNRNMNRITNIAEEALGDPELKLTRSWYEMQPLWDRMNQLGMSPEYQRMFNTRVGLHSAGASPVSEWNRGTGANWLIEQGRLKDYLDYAGVPDATRAKMHNSFPLDMQALPGHAYHSTAHSKPLINLEASGQLWTDRHKVPTYVQATDPILADPRRPIADAHLARGVGYSDVRTGGADNLFKELTVPEYGDFVPWWQKASEKVDMQPRDMQAMIWNALGPQTGVRVIGPGKLELLASQIMKTAERLGVSPETARDMVLTGKAGAFAEGGHVPSFDGGGQMEEERPQGMLSRASANLTAHRDQPLSELGNMLKELVPALVKNEGSRFADNAGYSPSMYGLDLANRVGKGVDKGVSGLWDLTKQRYKEAGSLPVFLANTAYRGARPIVEGMKPSFDFSREYGPSAIPLDFLNYIANAPKAVGGNLAKSLFDFAPGGQVPTDSPVPSNESFFKSMGEEFDQPGDMAKRINPRGQDWMGNVFGNATTPAPPPVTFLPPPAAGQQQKSGSPLDSIFDMGKMMGTGMKMFGGAGGAGGAGKAGSVATDSGGWGGGSMPSIDTEIGDWSSYGDIGSGLTFAEGGLFDSDDTGGGPLFSTREGMMTLGDIIGGPTDRDRRMIIRNDPQVGTGELPEIGYGLAPISGRRNFYMPDDVDPSRQGPDKRDARLNNMGLDRYAKGGSVDDEMLNYGTMFYDRGGPVQKFSQQGQVQPDSGTAGSILGTVGSLLGNLIPIPVLGPMIGKFAGHALGSLFEGKTGEIGDMAARDFTFGMADPDAIDAHGGDFGASLKDKMGGMLGGLGGMFGGLGGAGAGGGIMDMMGGAGAEGGMGLGGFGFAEGGRVPHFAFGGMMDGTSDAYNAWTAMQSGTFNGLPQSWGAGAPTPVQDQFNGGMDDSGTNYGPGMNLGQWENPGGVGMPWQMPTQSAAMGAPMGMAGPPAAPTGGSGVLSNMAQSSGIPTQGPAAMASAGGGGGALGGRMNGMGGGGGGMGGTGQPMQGTININGSFRRGGRI